MAQSIVKPTESCDKNKIVDSEFVSDTFQASEKDLEEVKAGMKMLGIDTLATQTSPNGKNCTHYSKHNIQTYPIWVTVSTSNLTNKIDSKDFD